MIVCENLALNSVRGDSIPFACREEGIVRRTQREPSRALKYNASCSLHFGVRICVLRHSSQPVAMPPRTARVPTDGVNLTKYDRVS